MRSSSLAVGFVLAVATRLAAADGGFCATLSADQQAAAGLPRLSTAERTALDQLVAADLTLVRRGDFEELAGTFASRLTDAQIRAAGLDRLPPAELTKLNELTAAALALHPKPKERRKIRDADVFNAVPKPEIHGSISLTYGRSAGGGSFHGSSLWVDYFDPASGLGLSVGLSNFSGSGFYGYYPGSSYGWPFYDSAPGFLEGAYRGPFRNDYYSGDGLALRGPYARDLSARELRRY
jgi:hypothetical protein